MTSFKDLDLKISYDSDEDDTIGDFLLPVLSNSKNYKRLAGYFNSSSLALSARGIKGLLRNNGTMQLVCGHQLSLKDKEAMEQGLEAKELSENFLKELEELEDGDFRKNHVKILGWMIKNKKIEIKIATVSDPGIFHMKVGVFEDFENNILCFSGSVNETASGWLYSSELIDVFKKWEPEDQERAQNKIDRFNKFWENKGKKTKVFDLPTAIQDKLIKIAPEDYEQIEINYQKQEKGDEIKIWDHQNTAVRKWRENNFQGIIAVATGGGKTIIALLAVELAEKSKIVIVVVPTKILQEQWVDEIKRLHPDSRIVRAGGNKSDDWETILRLILSSYKLSDSKHKNKENRRLYIVTTQDTASMNKFIDLWNGVDSSDVQLIVDEVHNAGSPLGQKIFNIPCDRRIGLSATHIRQFDEEGTDAIEKFFGGVVFTYSISDAIRDRLLCHYVVHHQDLSLTDQEFASFHEYTRAIGQSSAIIHSLRQKQKLDQIPFYTRKKENDSQERAKIIKSAQNKSTAFEEIIRQIPLNEKTIVFCTDKEQLYACSEILDQQSKNYRIYHSDNELSDKQRDEHIKEFERGDANILVGIGCLDEGLDIRSCTGCVLVSSDGSSRQYIQRRGRVLRLGDVGKIAHIYDLITYPPSLSADAIEEHRTTIDALLTHELRRTDILSEAADNRNEIENSLRIKFSDFGTTLEDIRSRLNQ